MLLNQGVGINQQLVEEHIKVIQRDINCIIDQDRNLRKQGLVKINEFMKQQSEQQLRIYIFDGYILKNMLRAIEDPVERNREVAVTILGNYINLAKGELNFEVLKLIIEGIINRLNQANFPENSEEIRLQLIKFLQELLKKQESAFRESLQRFAHMISKLLQDNFPEVKREAAILAAQIAKVHPIGDYMADTVKALSVNMVHAHTKVRKATIESLAPIILSRSHGSFLDLVIANVKALTLDKSQDVRKATFKCIAELLMHFSVNNLSNFENALLLMLLNGLSDENVDIQQYTIQILDEIGMKRQKLDEETHQIV